jgi:hypothetical protein
MSGNHLIAPADLAATGATSITEQVAGESLLEYSAFRLYRDRTREMLRWSALNSRAKIGVIGITVLFLGGLALGAQTHAPAVADAINPVVGED